jgi:DNA-binding transcriptional ArsR family regulator
VIFLAFRNPRESVTRRLILAAIESQPGCTKAEICRTTGLSWGSVSHHIRRCTRLGHVRAIKTDRKVFLYLPTIHSDQMTMMRLLRNDVVQRLVSEVRGHPGTGINALSRSLDVSRKIIRRHLADLVYAGVMERSADYRPKFRVVHMPVDLELPPRDSRTEALSERLGR